MKIQTNKTNVQTNQSQKQMNLSWFKCETSDECLILRVTDADFTCNLRDPVRHFAKKLLAWNEQYDDGVTDDKVEVAVAIIGFVMSATELYPHICSKFSSIIYTCQWDAILFVRMWPKCWLNLF